MHARTTDPRIRETIDQDLPRETALLQAYDRFAARIQEIVDLPNKTLDLLFRFLRQNAGAFSRRAREREFVKLTDAEVEQVEAIYRDEVGDL